MKLATILLILLTFTVGKPKVIESQVYEINKTTFTFTPTISTSKLVIDPKKEKITIYSQLKYSYSVLIYDYEEIGENEFLLIQRDKYAGAINKISGTDFWNVVQYPSKSFYLKE